MDATTHPPFENKPGKTYDRHAFSVDPYSGEPDTWAWESGYHNGPVCQRCHDSFCHHCEPERMTEPCTADLTQRTGTGWPT